MSLQIDNLYDPRVLREINALLKSWMLVDLPHIWFTPILVYSEAKYPVLPRVRAHLSEASFYGIWQAPQYTEFTHVYVEARDGDAYYADLNNGSAKVESGQTITIEMKVTYPNG